MLESLQQMHVFVVGDVLAAHRAEMGRFKLAVDEDAVARRHGLGKMDEGQL